MSLLKIWPAARACPALMVDVDRSSSLLHAVHFWVSVNRYEAECLSKMLTAQFILVSGEELDISDGDDGKQFKRKVMGKESIVDLYSQ